MGKRGPKPKEAPAMTSQEIVRWFNAHKEGELTIHLDSAEAVESHHKRMDFPLSSDEMGRLRYVVDGKQAKPKYKPRLLGEPMSGYGLGGSTLPACDKCGGTGKSNNSN